MTTVLVTDHPTGDLSIEQELLGERGIEILMAGDTSPEELTRLAARADAMLVCYAQIPGEVVSAAAAAGCRVISRYGIGFDNVDVDAATLAGIPVTNVPDYCIEEVADHTMALLLASARGVVAGAELVRDGEWRAPPVDIPRLRGRTLVIAGLGRIGVAVADRAQAFGLRLIGYDPFIADWSLDFERADSLADAVAVADFVSLHVPLSADTRHLVDAKLIAAMTRAPVLINTSRGGLVDTDALVPALDAGTLGWAALDVVDPEPLPAQHPLRTHPRVTLTPHTAFTSTEATADLQRKATDEVLRALDGAPPRSPVNRLAA